MSPRTDRAIVRLSPPAMRVGRNPKAARCAPSRRAVSASPRRAACFTSSGVGGPWLSPGVDQRQPGLVGPVRRRHEAGAVALGGVHRQQPRAVRAFPPEQRAALAANCWRRCSPDAGNPRPHARSSVGRIHEWHGTSVILASRGSSRPAVARQARREAQPAHQILRLQQLGVRGERQRVDDEAPVLERLPDALPAARVVCPAQSSMILLSGQPGSVQANCCSGGRSRFWSTTFSASSIIVVR